jgi:hypothetical protein
MKGPFLPSLRLVRLFCAVIVTSLVGIAPQLKAGDDDFDSYKIKITGSWFFSEPSGTFESSNGNGTVDISRDLGFSSYSTFAGKLDWKFTRKNHLYFVGSPFNSTRQTVLARTITFQGQTFALGLTTRSNLSANLYGPGYQYDIIRRKHGHLGIAAQLDLFQNSASITATTQVGGSTVQQGTVSAKGSLTAPIPVLGPEFRVYMTPRIYAQGSVYGMYFFGYGDFISASGAIGIRVAKHLNANAGYQLGSRLDVNNNGSDRIGLRLTQKGALAGVEFFF